MILRGTHRRYGYLILLMLVILMSAMSGYKLFAKDTLSLDSPMLVSEADCANPSNPIVAENCLPGTDEWLQVQDLNDVEGFASANSVNIGESIDFFVDSHAAPFTINLYRTGYYGGHGARLVMTLNDVQVHPQPACFQDFSTGLSTCSTWSRSYSLKIPTDWVSGVYIAKLVRSDTGGTSYILFVVRDDSSKSQMLYQVSTSTYQAYNIYGGKSVYLSGSNNACNTVAGTTEAVKVSLNRPYQARLFADNYNVYSHGDFAMTYWLESQGYDVTYLTSEDTHRFGKQGATNLILKHKVFLSVGHDEYWSQEIRDALTQARDAGVNLAFFSSNVGYWRTRYEPDPVTVQPDRILVVYKTTSTGVDDPSGTSTGTWRDPKGANKPENELVGSMYVGDNNTRSFPLRVSPEYAQNSIYRHTDLQSIPAGSYVNIGHNLIGWEWDNAFDNSVSPKGLEILASTPVNGEVLLDAGKEYSTVQAAHANVVRYVAPSGAIVFAAGTNRWTLGLTSFEAGASWFEANPLIQQMTYNLFADMGVNPATPASTLVLDGDTSGKSIPIEMGGVLVSEADAKAPTVSNITVNTDAAQAAFQWSTDVETNAQIWFSQSPDQINSWSNQTQGDYTTNHALMVSDLHPATTYYYKIVVSSKDESQTISETGSFQTAKGSLTSQVTAIGQKVYYPVRCWALGNTTAATVIGIGIVLLIGLVIGLGIRMVWKRRKLKVA
jgi:hypothetical protein